jgi:hypothetical protein
MERLRLPGLFDPTPSSLFRVREFGELNNWLCGALTNGVSSMGFESGITEFL